MLSCHLHWTLQRYTACLSCSLGCTRARCYIASWTNCMCCVRSSSLRAAESPVAAVVHYLARQIAALRALPVGTACPLQSSLPQGSRAQTEAQQQRTGLPVPHAAGRLAGGDINQRLHPPLAGAADSLCSAVQWRANWAASCRWLRSLGDLSLTPCLQAWHRHPAAVLPQAPVQASTLPAEHQLIAMQASTTGRPACSLAPILCSPLGSLAHLLLGALHGREQVPVTSCAACRPSISSPQCCTMGLLGCCSQLPALGGPQGL